MRPPPIADSPPESELLGLRLLAWQDLLPAHREGWPVLEAWSAKAVLPREPGEHCSSRKSVSLTLSLRLVTGFWIFRTQAPRTSNALPKINLLSCLNGRILR